MNSSLNPQRSALRALETKLLLELSSVRSQFNELSLINSLLPNEILCIIFHFCYIIHCTDYPRKSCLPFTEVCHKWRMLSLGMSTLWSTIDLCDGPHATLCLSKLGENALVSLVARTPSVQFQGSLEWVKGRVKKIDVVLFPNCVVKLIRSLARDEVGCCKFEGMLASHDMFGHRQQLRLENVTHLNLRIPSVSDPVDLSSLHVGSVSNLTLSGVRVNWASTSSNLKVLSLNHLPVPYAPTLEEFLEIFERAKDTLEEVYLEGFFSHSGHSLLSPALAKIETPHLRKLSILSKDREFSESIVSVLRFDPDTDVFVRFMGRRWAVVEGVLGDVVQEQRLEPFPDMLSMIGYYSQWQ
ncbi:hypothetical protein E1B28_011931 [Marasmius oreades]|uniref:F-box domain-containing protein n=1 Tax=Marasmius oreades TaxID=181124 RepID=A0A9P7RQI5_9AGAR|nr:uncharacterized protein E1B28_011931 [Marasmius oreades]KAG7087884.1 hypothetical protein E1B28_011931 [Marasmius oreades]